MKYYHLSILLLLFVFFLNCYLATLTNSMSPKNGPSSNLLKEKISLPNRMKKLLVTGIYSDVQFLVGEGNEKELLPAHKGVLAVSSDVFEAMFRFDAQNSANKKTEKEKEVISNTSINIVEVPDVDVEAFKVMLNFIYAEDLSELNGENAMAVLKAAKKYFIYGLIEACVALSIDDFPNVLLTYAEAKILDEKDFAKRCLDYIDQNVNDLIKSDQFLQVDQKLLSEILGRDQLMVKHEMAILNTALRWADEKCRRIGIECTAENRRKMLGPALYQIRFPLIPQAEFQSIISSSAGLLTRAEVDGILLYHSHAKNNENVPPEFFPPHFSIHKRISYHDTKGTFFMKIEKFSDFVQEKPGSKRYSDAVNIGGRSWQITAINKKIDFRRKLQLIIQSEDEKNDTKLKYPFSGTIRIVSQKEGKKDYVKEISGEIIFKWNDYCLDNILFTELISRKNGWYNKKEDSVILAVDFAIGDPSKVK